ncbi:MAG TPA: C10 family peptidase, partial [Phycisphaerae bacterium]|nr:C10 family peptidase [Phycisphaerae bacterium]
MPTGLQLNRARGRRHAVRRIRGDVAQAMVEALEGRLLLSSAGVSVNNAFLNHWTGYVNSSISVNVSGQWWQGTVGGGTAKTLVLGVHDLFGNWVNGTVPVVVQTGTPPANSPGSFWNWPLTLNVPAQGTYVIVAAEEPTSLSATAINDFKLGLEIAWAVAGTLTSSVAVPGMTVSNVSQTTWSSSVAGTISGSFTASVWNGSAGKNNVEAVVVGIRDMTGHWAAGSQPQVIDTMVPAVGSPGSSYAESFTGLSVPAKAGQYQVVVAEEPDPNSMLAFEAAADLATVTIGTLTVTASSTIWGPLLPFQTWDQAGLIAYGSSVNYNDYCPMDPATGKRSVTGCVATTVSELAYYWRSLSSLTFGAADAFTSSAGTTSAVRIDADSGTDQFPNMSTLTTGLSHIAYDYTPSQMALLAFGMGVKVQADYTSSSTSAYVTTTLLRSMGYSNAAINSNWGTGKNLAIANLKAGQPVIVDFPDHMAL